MLYKVHTFLKTTILRLVDFFYPLFRRFMPLQTYRYAACGGANTLLNIVLYFIIYNFILKRELVQVLFLTISPHIAAYLISFCITFPTGFYLSMYVIFPESYLRRRIQLFRYLLVALGCILLNYIFLKLFVDHLGWYPTPSLVVTTVFIIAFSYFSQRYFSFRKKVVDNISSESN